MRTSSASFFMPLLLLAFLPGALAQSIPYAGAWAGTASFHGTMTCTCSGPTPCPPPDPKTCDGTLPWKATVDASGSASVSTTTTMVPCAYQAIRTNYLVQSMSFTGRVSSNGALALSSASYPLPGGSHTCQPFTMQFVQSPPTVSGQGQCTVAFGSSNPTTGDTSSCNGSFSTSFSGAQTSTSPPPFTMTVTSNVTTTTASATAQVQAPSQIVGTTASIYVFAHARLSALKSTPLRLTDGAAPDPCVLAQLNANGQLVAASGSQLSAYTTGVIGSQAQSVTILNNVATPGVAGASFYVGYGATSGAMLSSGLYEGAVTVPGSNACSAALLAAAAPNAPGALSGQWWNPDESGWGVSLSQRNATVFAAWYTYDDSGKPEWYVASNCAMPGAGASGTCNGTLYEASGPEFFAERFDDSRVHLESAGSLQIAFADANNASMTYTLKGRTRTVAITRQVFQTGTTTPAVDYTDLWWNPNESGWGIAATQQYGVMFLAWFAYDGGRPAWYVATNCTVVGSACSGTVYKTSGAPFGPTFDAGAVRANPVGTIGVAFTDANNATITYTVNGVSGSKTVTRQLF